MKLKSLILGSVAAAGLSTAGYAADLGVLTSLDVCDALGLSGLTISSDTNCLQISGGVEYEFAFGDYSGSRVFASTPFGDEELDAHDDGTDWNSRVDYWLQFVGTADSDFGPASATIKIKETDQTVYDSTDGEPEFDAGSDTGGVVIDEAYVSIGDSTVLLAGKKSSIANFGDDEPLNFLGLFNSDEVDTGVGIDRLSGDFLADGGHVIQIVSDLGNGVSVGVGLEDLNRGGSDDAATLDEDEEDLGYRQAGTLVGVVSYAGEGISAHVTGVAGGILDGEIEAYAVHAGFTGTFDMFQVRAAGAFEQFDDEDFGGEEGHTWNVLASAAATFDLFTLAISGEAVGGEDDGDDIGTDFGVGGSIGANITEGVSINLGGRYYDNDLDDEQTYQVAVQLVAAVTETISVTGEAGYIHLDDEDDFDEDEDAFYGAAELGWAPGGDFTSTLRAEANTLDAYQITFNAAKTFQ